MVVPPRNQISNLYIGIEIEGRDRLSKSAWIAGYLAVKNAHHGSRAEMMVEA
jgi:hypothetical protein